MKPTCWLCLSHPPHGRGLLADSTQAVAPAGFWAAAVVVAVGRGFLSCMGASGLCVQGSDLSRGSLCPLACGDQAVHPGHSGSGAPSRYPAPRGGGGVGAVCRPCALQPCRLAFSILTTARLAHQLFRKCSVTERVRVCVRDSNTASSGCICSWRSSFFSPSLLPFFLFPTRPRFPPVGPTTFHLVVYIL